MRTLQNNMMEKKNVSCGSGGQNYELVAKKDRDGKEEHVGKNIVEEIIC